MGGSVSAIGLFTRNIVVPHDFPAVIPKLSVLLWASCPLNEKLPDFTVQMELPGGEKLPVQLPPAPTVENMPGAIRQQGLAVFGFVNLVIGSPGRLRLHVNAWNEEWIPTSLYIGRAEKEIKSTVDPKPGTSGKR